MKEQMEEQVKEQVKEQMKEQMEEQVKEYLLLKQEHKEKFCLYCNQAYKYRFSKDSFALELSGNGIPFWFALNGTFIGETVLTSIEFYTRSV